MHPGRKLFQRSPECLIIVSADYFPVPDEKERSFGGRLNPSVAGVCGSYRRCDAVVLSGVSRGAGRKNGEGFGVKTPHTRILTVGSDKTSPGRIADYLINGQPVTVTAGQEKTDYEKKKPQNIRFRKNTKNMAVKQINCGGRTRAPGLCRTGIFQKRDYVLNT